MKLSIITVLLIAFCHLSLAQGYKIDFKIEGLSDTTAFLGNYFGESTYLKDTAKVDSKGQFTFEGNEKLDAGLYFLVLNKTRLFDFIIDKDQEFKIETDINDYYADLSFEGSEQNELFLEDMKFNMARNEEAEPFVAIVQDSLTTSEQQKNAREALDNINTKVLAHQNEIIENHPDMLFARLLKSGQRLEIPETPEGENEAQFGYRYMKEHYWDNIDLGDASMLRVGRPIYKQKLENYFDRMIIPDADSITSEIDRLAVIAKANEDTYKYFIWTLTLKYQNPEIMGLDKVFVHMIDNYFETGEMDFWANAQLKKNLKERADQLRLSLIGKRAPNMIMMDGNQQMKSMYDINSKYTVIYFFDPDCGHCKKETPKLKEFYDNTKFDVEVFAVSADTSMTKMTKYVKDMNMNWITVNGPRTSTGSYHKSYDAMSTPTIYVLNENKQIIAKKVASARLEEFLTQYEKIQARKEEGN